MILQFIFLTTCSPHGLTWHIPGFVLLLFRGFIRSRPMFLTELLTNIRRKLILQARIARLRHSCQTRQPLWGTALVEKLTVPQLTKKYATFYKIRRFVAAFTTVNHVSRSLATHVSPVPRCTSCSTGAECKVNLSSHTVQSYLLASCPLQWHHKLGHSHNASVNPVR